ncbi:MAG: DNA-binding protein [Flavobacteriaceae bacterium]|nr:MAG: DNA-binding protein [Flavobacteriaceae bacterium]
MNKLLKYREKLNLTQKQLSEMSNISVRTIQRIEAGQELKGHTLSALSKVLEINKEKLVQDNSDKKEANIRLIKLINMSSLLLLIVPLGSIILPLIIMYWKKEVNSITKQIVSLQILWTLSFPLIVLIVIFLGNLFPLSKQTVPLTMLLLILVNAYIIIRNTVELDKNKKLYISLKFSLI